ncbi:MAG TPA: iron chelate uptake ABC transporter family permease subunit [Methanospirillum sp.]|jgi:iron complex transport system permease protein|uniref:FecCD family ABC transporter permease n=3 Tax=Methanospirillum sp. TaxID=45200 RepID=UPI001BD2FDB2|nr:iron chelate uptake ABC transporter family permease subunit [Methanospirillum sp.]HPY59766.1 iron chelate uptake ABC transporter family permease subunit [Methanospirillum sp.]HQB99198.1 iron chelate uptake ABC transporter family permease subunit [Methanospirillum sp.]
MNTIRNILILAGLGCAVVIAILLSVLTGPVDISLADILTGVVNDKTKELILFDIRMPRAIAAALVGAGLACAGAAMQTLFRNDLADPYTLGTSAGGAVGVSLAIISGVAMLVPVAAFCGAIGSAFLVYILAAQKKRLSTGNLLLTGIAVSMFFSSVVSVCLVLSGKNMHQIMFWLMGGLWNTSWADIPLLLITLIPAGILVLFSRDLNIMSCGEAETRTLGIDPEKTKLLLLGISAGITGLVVSVSGSIGFIGLVSPHIMRIITGPDHRVLIPASLGCGALLLVCADTISRTWLGDLPVGIVTAFFGAPFFLMLVRRRADL